MPSVSGEGSSRGGRFHAWTGPWRGATRVRTETDRGNRGHNGKVPRRVCAKRWVSGRVVSGRVTDGVGTVKGLTTTVGPTPEIVGGEDGTRVENGGFGSPVSVDLRRVTKCVHGGNTVHNDSVCKKNRPVGPYLSSVESPGLDPEISLSDTVVNLSGDSGR